MNVVEFQWFLGERGRISGAAIIPGGNVGVMLVVTLGFAFGGLILLTEMTAARFVAVEGVNAHQLGKLEEVCYAASLFQALVQVISAVGDVDVLPVLLLQRSNLANGRF